MKRLRACVVAALGSFASFVVAPLVGVSVALAIFVSLGLQSPEPPAAIDIGTLGGPYAFATAINNRQQVVGQSVDAAETRITAFLWEGGVMRDLSTAVVRFDLANDINDHGQIVGNGRDADGRILALVWEDGVLTELPIPAGASYCSPEAINHHGDIVGFCDQQPAQWGVLWPRSGDAVSLGPAPAGVSAGPVDINERGVILLGGVDLASQFRTWVWDKGVVTEVGNVPGGPLWLPTALNNRGQIAGWAGVPASTFAALLQDGVITALPQSTGHRRSGAEGLNDRGEVVGWDSTLTGAVAVMWAGGQMRVLPSLPGTTSSFARDINDRGAAIGTFATMPGETRSLLWPKASTRVPPRGERE
jgi:probable HAF family extracellular repeat protein